MVMTWVKLKQGTPNLVINKLKNPGILIDLSLSVVYRIAQYYIFPKISKS